MLKSVLFAVVVAISATPLSSACDHCNGAPTQWVTGCCDHEPSPADHLWDDYCSERNAPKCCLKRSGCTSCASGCMPGCSRWRPRPTGAFLGGIGGLRGVHGRGYGDVVEMPMDLYFEEVENVDEGAASEGSEEPAADDAAVEGASSETSAAHPEGCQCSRCLAATAAHGAGCQCPECLAGADPAKHGDGCNCPACKAAAKSAPNPNDVLGEAKESNPGELSVELTTTDAGEALEEEHGAAEESHVDEPAAGPTDPDTADVGEMEGAEESNFEADSFEANALDENPFASAASDDNPVADNASDDDNPFAGAASDDNPFADNFFEAPTMEAGSDEAAIDFGSGLNFEAPNPDAATDQDIEE